MKKLLTLLPLCILFATIHAQDCPELFVDVTKGTVNDLGPKSKPDDIKKALPCFSAVKPEGSMEDCGGGVFYAKQYLFFYTGADNINIRKGFTGKCSVELIGMEESKILEALGKPAGDLKDDEGVKYIFFKRSYGCLVVKMDDTGKGAEFFMYGVPFHEVNLCV